MKHSNQHTHECHGCGKTYTCHGRLKRNDDGFPETICEDYHEYEQRMCPTCSGTEEDD